MFSSFKLCAKYNTSHTIPCEFWLKVRPGLGVNWCKTCLGCNEKNKRESARTGIKNSFECSECNYKQPILLLKCQYRLLSFNYIWIQPHGPQNKHWCKLTEIRIDLWLQVQDLLFKSNEIWVWNPLWSKDNTERTQVEKTQRERGRENSPLYPS